ncbi:MAG: hypothetical protein JWO59_2791 [Chloroflexi bacterium]|nr:hypothetical protein [Chloroflexota bacterium]
MTAESMDTRLEAAASEGLDYLLNALRTGDFKPELLKTAQFLVEVQLAHEHQTGEEFTYSAEEEDLELEEEEDEEEDERNR